MDLSQQTQVSATLGYADSSSVSVPSGTAPSSVEQSQQAAASAQQTLDDDQRALAQAQASLDADLRKVAVDCRGGSRRERRLRTGSRPVRDRRPGGDGGSSGCHRCDRESAGRSARALGGVRDARPGRGVGGDLRTERRVHDAAEGRADRPRAASRCTRSTATPAFLLYGGVPASRAFMPGMSAGADVGELNRDLRGYGAPSGDVVHRVDHDGDRAVSIATSRAGDRAVAARVGRIRAGRGTRDERDPDRGLAGASGAAARDQLDAPRRDDRTRRVAADEHQGRRPVLITLPDNSTTPGHVSYVGTVATVPSDQSGGGSSSPTIEVDVAPDRRQQQDGSTRHRSMCRSRRRPCATSSPCR